MASVSPESEASSSDLVSLVARTYARSPLPVCLLDPDRAFAWVNARFASLVAVPLDAFPGKAASEVLPSLLSDLGEVLQEVRRTGEGWRDPERSLVLAGAPDGPTGIYDVTVHAAIGGSGAFSGWLITVDDLSRPLSKRPRTNEAESYGNSSGEASRPQPQGSPSQSAALQLQHEQIERQQLALQAQSEERERLVSEVVERDGEIRAQLQATVERERLLSEVERGKASLEAVLQSLPVGVAIVDGRGGVIMINKMYDTVWSGPRPIPKSVDEYAEFKAWWADTGKLVEPEEWASARALSNGEAVIGQVLKIQRFDGTIGFVVNSGVPIFGAEGSVVGSAVAIMDITDLKRAEEAIARSEERYRTLFDNLSEGFAIHEMIYDESGNAHDYRFLDVNGAFERLTGLKRSTTVGRTVREVIPNIEQHWIDRYAAVVATGVPDRFDAYSAPLGRHYEVVALSPKPGQFATLFLDISDRKRAEVERERLLAEVQNRAAELDGVIKSMSEAVMVYDRAGVVIKSNPALAALLGSDASGPSIADVVRLAEPAYPDGRPVPVGEMPASRALRGEEVKNEHLIVNPAGGRRRHVLASASPLAIEGNVAGAVSIWRDATDLIELDLQKEQFISVAAHELKTPVAIMKGYAQALLRSTEEASARRRRMLDAIDRGANRIAMVVDDLLDISRLQAGGLELVFERIDLPGLVEEVVDKVALTASKHHLRTVVPTPAVVPGDRDRLEQVLTNLLDNALRYSPQGGVIEVAVESRRREAVVSVKDHGVGIPADKQADIFRRFFRAHTGTPYDYGGMGVSLYISNEIVKRHAGRMWFKSAEGSGSTFYFSIPWDTARD